MYCDGCGTPFSAGTQYCSSCGKHLMAAPAAQATPAAAAMARPAGPASDGRVRRNLNIVAALWLASGVLRLLEVGGLMIFRKLVFQSGWGWMGPGSWPFGGAFGWNPLLFGGLLTAGVFMVVFGAAYLLLAWGLLERQPWARMLGIVLAFLALLRFPLGTALGIYTLWVLLPENSEREYDAMAGAGRPVNAA